jgi:prepilin-type processing-associated H-X9-DG protein
MHNDTLKTLPAGGGMSNLWNSWLVVILPYVEQNGLFNQYNLGLPYNNNVNLAVGVNKVPIYYCPAGSPLLSGNSAEAFNGIRHPSTHYRAVMGPNGAFTAGAPAYPVSSAGANGAHSQQGAMPYNIMFKLVDIIDGTSNTFLIGERSNHETTTNSYRSWIRGNNGGCGACQNVATPINSTNYNGSNNFNDISFGSNHVNGTNFAFGDGSVRYVTQSVDMLIYLATASRAWNEPKTVE